MDITQIPHWQAKAGQPLARTFTFADFSQAFRFMTGVAMLAEQHDHHPDWSNSYNKVEIKLITHSKNEVTDKDINLAAAIDELVK